VASVTASRRLQFATRFFERHSKVKGGDRTKAKIVASILGSVSGYLLGYKLGEKTIPNADSREVQQLLANKKFWDDHHVQMYLAMCYRLLKAAQTLREPEVRHDVEQFVLMLGNEAIDSQDGLDLDNVTYLRELNQKFARANATRQPPYDEPWWLSWWFIASTIALSVCVSIVIALFVVDRRARTQRPLRIINY
jgi:hypothetical protein